jgi:hypothetical protein
VVLELGKKRVFASAIDWPGWSRSGRTEEAALEALAAYYPRYAAVAKRAGVAFPKRLADTFEVVERQTGDASTEFGVPGRVGKTDERPLTTAQARRAVSLLTAAWEIFDEIVAGAPASLRKGPRGGGRDRDKIAEHVVGAEAGYARQLGLRHKPPAADDRRAIEALRADVVEVLSKRSDGSRPTPKGWPPRYAVRRFTWHVLDHAWEIEDKSEP